MWREGEVDTTTYGVRVRANEDIINEYNYIILRF